MESIRRTLIVKIHIAKKDLAMDDETYRDVLQRVTGKDSCKNMTVTELKKVISDMKRLGFTPKQTTQSIQKQVVSPLPQKTDKHCYPKLKLFWRITICTGIMPMLLPNRCLGWILCIGCLRINFIKLCKP